MTLAQQEPPPPPPCTPQGGCQSWRDIRGFEKGEWRRWAKVQSCRQIETDVQAEADQQRQKGGKEMETEDKGR